MLLLIPHMALCSKSKLYLHSYRAALRTARCYCWAGNHRTIGTQIFTSTWSNRETHHWTHRQDTALGLSPKRKISNCLYLWSSSRLASERERKKERATSSSGIQTTVLNGIFILHSNSLKYLSLHCL